MQSVNSKFWRTLRNLQGNKIHFVFFGGGHFERGTANQNIFVTFLKKRIIQIR